METGESTPATVSETSPATGPHLTPRAPQNPAVARLVAILMPVAVLVAAGWMIAIGMTSDSRHKPRYPSSHPVANDSAVPLANLPGAQSGGAIMPAPGFPRTVVAGDGAVTIPTAPARIVSCTLGSDEILLDLVDQSRLLAITKLSTDPQYSFVVERVREWPAERLVAGLNISTEEIAAWNADLIFVSSWTDENFKEQIRKAGIPLVQLHNENSLAAIRQNIELIATAVGADDAGKKLLADFDTRLAAVREKAAVGNRPRALFLSPFGDSLGTIGGGHTFHDCLETAGYENLAATVFGLTSMTSLQFPQLLTADAETPVDLLIVPTARELADGSTVDALQRLTAFAGAEQLSPLRANPPRVLRMPGRFTDTTSHHILAVLEFLAAHRPAN